jgi:hypothetical protein
MKALPWIRMLNTMADTMLRAAMKQTDPPIALPDTGFIAPMNFNPRALNYYKKGNLDPNKDIAPIGNYGNVAIGMQEMEYYANKAGDMMFKNAFLAFQGITKQMTVPEVMQRANEAMTLLGPAVGRYMSDDLTNALSIAGQIAQFKPEALDKINADATIDELWGITNAPANMLFDAREVAEIRQARAQQMATMQEMEAAQAIGKVGKDLTQASLNEAQAQNVPTGAGV